MIIDLKDISLADAQNYLQAAVAPRPIGLVSSMDKDGKVNLAPFSFFNLFSTNPPVVIFSPSRRVRDNSSKHTLENMYEVPEVVIHICDYEMVHQVSLASAEYAKGVNEFIKAGFTEEAASIVRPPMVKEAKIKMECRVDEIKPLGKGAGAGNLIICEILRLHVDESILDDDDKIDQRKIKHVARMGSNWYSKIDQRSLFEIEKPAIKNGIGVDALPVALRESNVLSKNNLAQLAGVAAVPVYDACKPVLAPEVFEKLHRAALKNAVHYHIRQYLDQGKVAEAWQIVLAQKHYHESHTAV